MKIVYYIFAALSILTSVLPLIPNQHWFFRSPEFGKVQNTIIQSILIVLGLVFIPKTIFAYIILAILIACVLAQGIQLWKYTPFYHVDQIHKDHAVASKDITVISANVFQFNEDFQKFIQLIQKYDPDIFLTMESNQAWQDALSPLEKDYPYKHLVPLENTYGIHLYSKVEIQDVREHYFIADDIPSIEAQMKTSDGYIFNFFGVHPPPPSPTEEETSKERDGELLSVAKVVKSLKDPSIVVGDFNTVAWSKPSTLFRKTSETIDPRIGRGLISTFHAKYFFLRFPIDQLYHSTDIFVKEIRALENFGSDHLPLYCKFYIDKVNGVQDEQVEELEAGDQEEVEEMIEDGIEEDGERDAVVTE